MNDNPLLEAVEHLTLPHRSLVTQTNDAGISCVSEVHHIARLQMLKHAVGANVGKHSNISQAREKIPLNVAAYEKFKQIADQIAEWQKGFSRKRTKPVYEEIWTALGRWYITFENERRRGVISHEREREVQQIVYGWSRDIDNMFDPPEVIELTKRCPLCFQRWAYDRFGDLIPAVVTEYRNLGPDTLTYANALCRSCETIWPGLNGIRWLSYEMDHPALSPDELEAVRRFGLDHPEHDLVSTKPDKETP